MKNLTLCLCLLLLFLFSQPALAVSAQLPIMLDGINISAPDYPADNQPAILAQEHSGTAYVPLRFIAELFNAEVSWQEQKIIISNGSNTIKIQLGSQQAVCNNESITLSGAPYEYQNTTYVPFRAVTEALRPDAQVAWERGQAVARAEDLSLSAQPGASYIEANGRALYAPTGVYSSQGSTLVPVRVLAAALGAQVDWEPASGTVTVTGGSGAIAPAGERYPEQDLYWLSRIISAESRGEPLLGKLAVGTVVLNRVRSDEFPNTVREVIFDRKWGVQFTPVANGTVYDEPTQESLLAAKLVLDGARAAGNSLYFIAPELTDNHWTMENRTYVTTIGCHWFYE